MPPNTLTEAPECTAWAIAWVDATPDELSEIVRYLAAHWRDPEHTRTITVAVREQGKPGQTTGVLELTELWWYNYTKLEFVGSHEGRKVRGQLFPAAMRGWFELD